MRPHRLGRPFLWSALLAAAVQLALAGAVAACTTGGDFPRAASLLGSNGGDFPRAASLLGSNGGDFPRAASTLGSNGGDFPS